MLEERRFDRVQEKTPAGGAMSMQVKEEASRKLICSVNTRLAYSLSWHHFKIIN